jgi:hypothetical protein
MIINIYRGNNMKIKTLKLIYPALMVTILSLSFPISAESQKTVALVVKTSGISYLLRDKKRSPIKVNDFVLADDIIQTKKNGTVHIQFSSGIIFLIGTTVSDSEVKIKKFEKTEKSQNIGLELLKGSLAASSEKLAKGENITVSTPTAIAGVRGTEFIVDYNQTNTEVMVNEGSVAVSDKDEKEEIIVEPGKKVIATTKGLQMKIMEQFEKQRFEIFKALEESKQKNMEALIQQIERDRQNLESVKNPFNK